MSRDPDAGARSEPARDQPGFSVRAAAGRADLFRALDRDGEAGLLAMAQLLGYEEEPRRRGRDDDDSSERPSDHEGLTPPPSASAGVPDLGFEPLPFWRPVAAELSSAEQLEGALQPEPEKKDVADLVAQDLEPPRDAERPRPQPIVAWPRLWRRLDDRLRTSRPRAEIDTVELVRRWARGENVEPLPRLPGLVHSRLVILLDRSPELQPFWRDQMGVVVEVLLRLGARSARLVPVDGTTVAPLLVAPDERVLALTDLGSLGDRQRVELWERLGRRLRRSNRAALALVCAPPSRWPRRAAELWSALDWSAPSRRPQRRAAAAVEEGAGLADPVETLLCLASPAIRLETGLLRDLRRLVPGADLGTEVAVWFHPAVASRSNRGLTLHTNEARRRRPRFVELPENMQRRAMDRLRAWHRALAPEIWAEEVVGLVAAGVPEPWLTSDTVEHVAVLVQKICAKVDRKEEGKELGPGTDAYFKRFLERASPQVWAHPTYRRPLSQAMAALREREADVVPPAGTIPEMLPPSQAEAQRWGVWQEGSDFRFRPHGEGGEGSWLCSLTSRKPAVYAGDQVGRDVELDLDSEGAVLRRPKEARVVHFTTDVETVRLELWKPPPWTSASGRDPWGLWASFEVDGVEQRMRWIPPGRFQMGSPDTEDGRWEREGPRHWVLLSEGFWLAETPCTQALWAAVMGENPSDFPSPNRPVEQVSWDHGQEFLDRLNGRVRGLEAWLPTEAEWEYACRAGTETATWRGDLEILGERNAPILDEIAWYGGNSGVDYDLKKSVRSSGWKEKQYRHTRAGSREVGEKRPNPWGLYDMLGNVFEWCWDVYDEYGSELEVDPEGAKEGPGRVIRGGSWDDRARDVRAAYRGWSEPGIRSGHLGFRLARGQGPQGAEPSPVGSSSERVGRGTSPRRRSRRAAAWVERLEWAVEGGADGYGRWAAFEVGGVKHRMRWLGPGRFLMGSPEGEAGRWDDEGPRHEVTLTEGFWLGEAPCAQALWQVVMGENPSRFVSPNRPVEQVSWEDCREFLQRLNQRNRALEARLPTEAEWEYACRAGTSTATWLGDLRILGERHAPLLDDIAWYGGNSGVGFDLENGYDSSDWAEIQYAHTRAGTREVAQKDPNPWGLYDMLGNVEEWCSDLWADRYPGGPRTDPPGPEEGPGRVFRGGSWYAHAQSVRAAFRSWRVPGSRYDDLGFRLARGQGRIQ